MLYYHVFDDVSDLGVAATVLVGKVVHHRGDRVLLVLLPLLTKNPPHIPIEDPPHANIARRRLGQADTRNTEREGTSKDIGIEYYFNQVRIFLSSGMLLKSSYNFFFLL